ncbi:MAG: hypothetical protein HQL77_11180 [Magnetococcales bacterium]|nr:hypothetical protein [Magnetococcales bacterium]
MDIKQLLQKFLNKEGSSDAQVGLSWDDTGLSMALVSGMLADTPSVKVLHHTPWEEGVGRSLVLLGLAKRFDALKVPYVFCMDLDSYSLFPNDAADVPLSELAQAMKWAVRDRLDFSVEEAIVDCFFIPDTLRVATQRKVYVAATRKEDVKKCLEIIRPTRLELKAIEITELALNNLASFLPESPKGLALLYFPPVGEWGCLLVCRGGSLFLARRVAAMSADALELGIDPGRAMASDVQRSLNYAESNFFSQPVEILYLIAIPETDQLLRHSLTNHLNVRIKTLQLDFLFKGPTPEDPIAFIHALPALGAALRSVETTE